MRPGGVITDGDAPPAGEPARQKGATPRGPLTSAAAFWFTVPLMPRTVLVVDPSPLSARRAEEALRGTGFEVMPASTLSEAEAALDGREVSVTLAALSFPRGNGYDLARMVRARHPEAVVFLLSGAFEVYNQERARSCGVHGRIPRPFSSDVLRRHLEGVLGPLGEGSPSPTPAEPPPEPPRTPPHVPTSEERLATFLPRDYRSAPPVTVDPQLIGPPLERAILEVLPEVVEAVLSQAVHHSPAFRDLVTLAVEDAVRLELERVVQRAVDQALSSRGLTRGG